MLVLTNDLNEREDQLIAMKKREEAYLEQLASKDRMYEQDAMVRMQLGKRLEQVLMDKEEIKDELDDLKVLFILLFIYLLFPFFSLFIFNINKYYYRLVWIQ